MATDGAVLELVLASLEAATSGRTPFTLGQLATVDADGRPRVRGVILRAVDRAASRVMIATDVRSAKVAELRANPAVALALTDDERGFQLRIEGTARVVEDAAARRRAWDGLSPLARAEYDSPVAPGTPLGGAPLAPVAPVPPAGREPAAHGQGGPGRAAGFEHFAWVEIALERLDWLDLAAEPSERWLLERRGEDWVGAPVAP